MVKKTPIAFSTGRYKSRTESTRTANPGRINSDCQSRLEQLGPPTQVGSTRIDSDRLIPA